MEVNPDVLHPNQHPNQKTDQLKGKSGAAMETTNNNTNNNREGFQIGQAVMYGLNGRCEVVGIESLTAGGTSQSFYKLEQRKLGPIAKQPNKKETAIWVPTDAASKKGLRPLIRKDEVDAIMAILQDREAYFPTDLPFNKIQPQFEQAMLEEGATGFAKVVSYMKTLQAKKPVLESTQQKYFDGVYGVLLREVAEVTEQTLGQTEELFEKALRNKGHVDH